jgi:MYXO-CTERM domain-containing protein
MFTISASSGAVTPANPTDTATLTVTPQNSFSGTVNFSCSGLPSDVTCSFYPVSLTPSAGVSASTAVTFTESTKALLDRSGDNTQELLYAGFGLGGVLLLFGVRRRRALFRTVAVVIAVLSLAWIVSCGSSGGGGSHQMQTSTVTITATSGSLTHNVTYTLTSN